MRHGEHITVGEVLDASGASWASFPGTLTSPSSGD
jgi:hypothetical protein